MTKARADIDQHVRTNKIYESPVSIGRAVLIGSYLAILLGAHAGDGGVSAP